MSCTDVTSQSVGATVHARRDVSGVDVVDVVAASVLG
jgi:hypothetical protein